MLWRSGVKENKGKYDAFFEIGNWINQFQLSKQFDTAEEAKDTLLHMKKKIIENEKFRNLLIEDLYNPIKKLGFKCASTSFDSFPEVAKNSIKENLITCFMEEIEKEYRLLLIITYNPDMVFISDKSYSSTENANEELTKYKKNFDAIFSEFNIKLRASILDNDKMTIYLITPESSNDGDNYIEIIQI